MNAAIQDEAATALTKRRRLVGIWKNLPSEKCVVLFADATANRDDLADLLGRPIVDVTPTGHVAHAKRIVQYPIDLTRKASPRRLQSILRGLLTEFSHARRVGVITHRSLVAASKRLGDPFASRIIKVAYFGSGADRASNDWHVRCDLVIVAGTPRVPGEAMQRRLIQFGDFDSAGDDGRWGTIRWRGQTESGREVIVEGRGYDHPGWERGHRALVRAAIKQAAGRGRTLLDTGCDVAVVSNEECGFFLADNADIELTECEAEALTELTRLSAEFSYRTSKDFPPMRSPMTTEQLGERLKLSVRRMREILVRLESRQLVRRVGERGGWILNGDTPAGP